MKDSKILPVTILLLALGVLGLHASSTTDSTAKDKPHMPWRYTAVELAEETIEAYQALENNDVELAKKILLNAIVNYIEDDERGGSVMPDAKTDKKAKRVREEFGKIYADLMGFED